MTEEPADFFEKVFGKKPAVGYEFTHVSFSIVNRCINFQWGAKGVGFGEYALLFKGEEGFDIDAECMSHEFGIALIDEVCKRIDAGQKAVRWKELNPFEKAKYWVLSLFGKQASYPEVMGYKEVYSTANHEDFIKHVALTFKSYLVSDLKEDSKEDSK